MVDEAAAAGEAASMDTAPVEVSDAPPPEGGIGAAMAASASAALATSVLGSRGGSRRGSEVDIPEAYCCPITHLLMIDPVVTCDGHTCAPRCPARMHIHVSVHAHA